MDEVALKDLTAQHMGKKVRLRFHARSGDMREASEATGTLTSVTHDHSREALSKPKTLIEVKVLNERITLTWPSDATLEFIEGEEPPGLLT